MKSITRLFFVLFSAIMISHQAQAQSEVLGAWKSTSGNVKSLMLVTPGYFSITVYDTAFKYTLGGTWEGGSDNKGLTTIEFNSADPSQVGKQIEATVDFEGGQLETTLNGITTTWTKVDNGNSEMMGVWQITGRKVNGKMNEMRPGDRKTIKILSGTKFQWIAMNTKTGEFFGTGGGTYTFKDGVYTEQIEFFSRDNSRVGKSFSFQGSVKGDKWDHSGKSSKGDPIHEEWTRR